jgi:predicted nucleotidyltransferase
MAGNIALLLEAVSEWADRYPCIKEAYIFGSFVRDDVHDGSDIDIGLELDDLPGHAEMMVSYNDMQAAYADWAVALGERFGRRVEISGQNAGAKKENDPAWDAIQEALKAPPLARLGKALVLVTRRKP